MSELLIYPKDLPAIVGLSRCTVLRGIAAGWFPSPVRISPRRVAWRREDVVRWVAERRVSVVADAA